jgi:hypothetical protein
MHGPVKSVTEKVDPKDKYISGYIRQYEFNAAGKLVSYIETFDGSNSADTVDYVFIQYGKDGLIENVSLHDVASKSYRPEYNKEGDLIKEKFIQAIDKKGRELGIARDYVYDANGNLTEKKEYDFCDDGFEAEVVDADEGDEGDEGCYYALDHSFKYTYENNELKQIVEAEKMDAIFETQYNFDVSGLIASKQFVLLDGDITYYFHETDDKNNWIEEIAKIKGHIKSESTREITYYSDKELVAANVKVKSKDNISVKPYTHITFIDRYINKVLARKGTQGDSPNKVLFIILVICTVILAGTILAIYFKDFLGFAKIFEDEGNGMRKYWMYKPSPYIIVAEIMLVALFSFVASVLLILLFGGVIWGLLWLVKLILLAIIIIGYICLVLGALGILAKEPMGCLVIVGIVIVIFQEKIAEFGDKLVNWGFEFMQSINMFSWGIAIFKNYSDAILAIFFTPMGIFLAFAALIIGISMLLNGFEYIVTRIYSIRRPCPICGSTATPDYIIGGKPHPVKLRPGVYGILTHRSPVTGQKVPTMLINGKGRLIRRCKNCNSFINADTEKTFGTEIHIGIVGHRSSGKSYLLYSGLASLMETYPDRFSQIDADSDTKIENKKKRIDAHDGIQTDVANRYRAIQLILKSKLRPVPYHLFFYDVAGEKFDANSSSHKTAMDFYKNVQSIAFIIDPSMLDIKGTPASAKFENWQKSNANSEKYRVEAAFAVLKDVLEMEGRKSNIIDFNFICTKSDMGYLTELGYPIAYSENDIETFISTELGLSNLINSARASFKSVHFHAVSAIDCDKSKLTELFIKLLEQRKITLK